MKVLLAVALLGAPAQAGVLAVAARGGRAAASFPLGGKVFSGPAIGRVTARESWRELRGGVPRLPTPAPGLIRGAAGPARLAGLKPEPRLPVAPEPAVDWLPALRRESGPDAYGLGARADAAAGASRRSESPSAPGLSGAALAEPDDEESVALGRRLFDEAGDEAGLPARQPWPTLLKPASHGRRAGGKAFWPGLTRGSRGGLLTAGQLDSAGPETPAFFNDEADASAEFSAMGRVLSPRAIDAARPDGAWPLVWSRSGPPQPLALSGRGLVLRLRSASAAPIRPLGPRNFTTDPALNPGAGLFQLAGAASTALLERGALLEAFSAAEAAARFESVWNGLPWAPRERASRRVVSSARDFVPQRRPAVVPRGSSVPLPLALWWLWTVPLTAAAWRGSGP